MISSKRSDKIWPTLRHAYLPQKIINGPLLFVKVHNYVAPQEHPLVMGPVNRKGQNQASKQRSFGAPKRVKHRERGLFNICNYI